MGLKLAGLVSSGVGRQSPGTDASARPRGRLDATTGTPFLVHYGELVAFSCPFCMGTQQERRTAPRRRPCTQNAALHPEGGPGAKVALEPSRRCSQDGPAAMNEEAGNLVLAVAGERIERIKSERLALCLRQALEGQHRHVVGGAAVRVLV